MPAHISDILTYTHVTTATPPIMMPPTRFGIILLKKCRLCVSQFLSPSNMHGGNYKVQAAFEGLSLLWPADACWPLLSWKPLISSPRPGSMHLTPQWNQQSKISLCITWFWTTALVFEGGGIEPSEFHPPYFRNVLSVSIFVAHLMSFGESILNPTPTSPQFHPEQ